MHELAIAESVVQIASRHAGERPVAKVFLRVGHLRQVVPSALTFAFGLVAQGTPVDGAELEIEPVPAAGRCRRCDTHGELPGFPLLCPECASADIELVQGEELQVESLELHDTEPHDALATSGGRTR